MLHVMLSSHLALTPSCYVSSGLHLVCEVLYLMMHHQHQYV